MPEIVMPPEPPDWRDVCPEVSKQILAQADTYLRAQMQLALDADKRAITLATSCAAFSTAAIAASLVAYNAGAGINIVAPFIVISIWMICAACVAFYSARPVVFCLPGNEPKAWWGVALDEKAHVLIGGETENYQDRIDTNTKFLNENSRYTKIAMVLFASSPLAFVITFSLLTS